MIQFTYQVQGIPDYRAASARLIRLFRDTLQEVERKGRRQRPLARALAAEIRNNFSRRTDPQTTRRWADLKKGGPATLIKTGRLLQNVRTARPWRVEQNKLTFTLPKTVAYGANHQRGNPSRNLPRRGFLPNERQVQSHMQRILTREVFRRWDG